MQVRVLPRASTTRKEPNMRPLNNNVLIAELVPEEKTHHGVVIPQTTKLGYGVGVVTVIHDGTLMDDGTVIPCKVKPGNMVAFHVGSGVEIAMGEQRCRLMLEGNIIAVLQEDYKEKMKGELLSIVKEDGETVN